MNDSLKSKRDFGSFQSSNVEELINIESCNYMPPKLSIDIKSQDYFNNLINLDLFKKFGSREIKQALFYLKENEFVFLNHGAFGVCFKPTLKYVYEWTVFAEQQPLRFNDRLALPLLADVIRLFAQNVFFCQPNELVLVDNCTFAFNSIANSLTLDSDNYVLLFSTTYGCYKKILRSKCEKVNSKLIEVTIEFPIRNKADLLKIVQNFEENYLNNFRCEDSSKIKYLFIDLIPSNHPFMMPLKEIIDLCKSKRPDIICIVDAAHGLGSVKDFNFKSSSQILTRNIDFMFTNCHKWLCGPKGTGFLFKNQAFDKYHPSRHLLMLKPAVQSHGIDSGFNSEFIWTGLKDYSIQLGLYSTYQIWQNCLNGFEHAIDYCTRLAHDAANYLCQQWSTECLVEASLCSTMVCVELPKKFMINILLSKYEQQAMSEGGDYSIVDSIRKNNLELTYSQAEIIQNFFYFSHNIEIPIKSIQNTLFVRISAHIYNKLDDYIYLSKIVKENSQ